MAGEEEEGEEGEVSQEGLHVRRILVWTLMVSLVPPPHQPSSGNFPILLLNCFSSLSLFCLPFLNYLSAIVFPFSTFPLCFSHFNPSAPFLLLFFSPFSLFPSYYTVSFPLPLRFPFPRLLRIPSLFFLLSFFFHSPFLSLSSSALHYPPHPSSFLLSFLSPFFPLPLLRPSPPSPSTLALKLPPAQ